MGKAEDYRGGLSGSEKNEPLSLGGLGERGYHALHRLPEAFDHFGHIGKGALFHFFFFFFLAGFSICVRCFALRARFGARFLPSESLVFL